MDLQSLILATFGGVLSLIFSFAPGISDWYYGLDPRYRGLVMAGFAFLVTAGIWGVSCTGWYQINGVSCTQQSAIDLVKAFVTLLIGNQLTYLVTPAGIAKTRIDA